jgi:hypothetical protein
MSTNSIRLELDAGGGTILCSFALLRLDRAEVSAQGAVRRGGVDAQRRAREPTAAAAGPTLVSSRCRGG